MVDGNTSGSVPRYEPDCEATEQLVEFKSCSPRGAVAPGRLLVQETPLRSVDATLKIQTEKGLALQE